MSDLTGGSDTPLEKPPGVKLSFDFPEGKLKSTRKLLFAFARSFGLAGLVLVFGAFIAWCFAIYHGSGVDAVIGAAFMGSIFYWTLKVFERMRQKDR